ncbi:MAG TPA: carboxyl transferase domain-containing protein, partial [Acidimicrobiales bacterium]|nr:carboxyl transferase domain-containing protein [Acidimicrobiales bacterium]
PLLAARLPVGRGRPGNVEAGVGHTPCLPVDGPVAWFRGSPVQADTEVIARTVATGVDAGVPVVGVLSGVGVDATTGLASLHGWGALARALADASGLVPVVLVVDGPCLGGTALVLGLVDVVVMTARATAFVNGPQASARITGSATLDADLLGGAWVHGARTGVADLVVDDLGEAFDLVADLLDHLPPNNHETPPAVTASDLANRATLRAADAVPRHARASYDVRQVITDLVDDQAFLELRARFGTSVVTGLARVAGLPVGILANQPSQLAGALDIEGSQKGARFIRFCDAFNLPIVTLVDTPGFRPGRDQEWRGMIRHGAKLAFAYAEATVPRVCVVLRKAYGGAYIVMDCKSMGNDCALAWPSAEIAVMGAKGAVEIVHRRALNDATADVERETRRSQLEADYEAVHLSPTAALERGYVDEIIDPADTRGAVAGALLALTAKRERLRPRRHDNIPL